MKINKKVSWQCSTFITNLTQIGFSITEIKRQLQFLLYGLLRAFNQMLLLQSAFTQHSCQSHLLDKAMHLENVCFWLTTASKRVMSGKVCPCCCSAAYLSCSVENRSSPNEEVREPSSCLYAPSFLSTCRSFIQERFKFSKMRRKEVIPEK